VNVTVNDVLSAYTAVHHHIAPARQLAAARDCPVRFQDKTKA